MLAWRARALAMPGCTPGTGWRAPAGADCCRHCCICSSALGYNKSTPRVALAALAISVHALCHPQGIHWLAPALETSVNPRYLIFHMTVSSFIGSRAKVSHLQNF